MSSLFAVLLLAIVIASEVNGLHVVHIDTNDPPPIDHAKMARFIINSADWAVLSSISTLPNVTSYPFTNVESMCDGPVGHGTGTPYFYMTPIDVTAADLVVDNRCTMLASLAETTYCKNHQYDPQDPRCGRLMLTGRFVKVNETTQKQEYKFAKDTMFARHPSMTYWPDHNWFIGKLNIQQVALYDSFKGMKEVTVEDYFKANSYDVVPEADNNILP